MVPLLVLAAVAFLLFAGNELARAAQRQRAETAQRIRALELRLAEHEEALAALRAQLEAVEGKLGRGRGRLGPESEAGRVDAG